MSRDNEDMTVKLCDFGFAINSYCQKEPFKLTKMVGSPYYIAPEVFSEAYDSRCDLWSAGVLLYFMICHSFPFQGQTPNEIFYNIKHSLLTFEGSAWDKISDDAKDLISRLLVRDPSIRLSASEALQHRFFKKP